MKKIKLNNFIDKNSDLLLDILIVIIVIIFFSIPLVFKDLSIFPYIVQVMILFVTFLYVMATRRIAIKTAESVEASKKLSETTVQIEKDRLTYELIKEWNEDKKFLTYKRQELRIFKNSVHINIFASEIENYKKFITYMDNFFDYFLLVYKLINGEKINKNMYFEVLGKEIVKFKYNQLEENADISSDVRSELRMQQIDLPVISDREWFDKIFKIANEKYKITS